LCAGIQALMRYVIGVEITFGGMFAGHGVYVTGGNARLTLREYLVAR
jgi:hypothetical protein